jgi:hypothetical protein
VSPRPWIKITVAVCFADGMTVAALSKAAAIMVGDVGLAELDVGDDQNTARPPRMTGSRSNSGRLNMITEHAWPPPLKALIVTKPASFTYT